MEVSEARLAANRQNATRSTGPTSEQGKAISRRNSLKHGLTGEGIVLLEGDQAEVESRFQALRDELQPQSSLGSMLIRKIATFSVRSERASERENLVIAERARTLSTSSTSSEPSAWKTSWTPSTTTPAASSATSDGCPKESTA